MPFLLVVVQLACSDCDTSINTNIVATEKQMNYTIHHGDNRDTLKTLESNSIDAIITDPPYGIDFLGKSWDANTGALETYTECLRVLKPGGYILAFSAARTYHHLAITLEQAGFEIRDQIMWLYSSGFPKAQDIGKALQKRGIENEYHGWKTALKPAHEPVCMARKPFKGSSIDNVLAHGVGALNIDATRIDWDEKAQANIRRQNALGGEIVGGGIEKYATVGEDADGKHETQRLLLNDQGRFPSNVIGEVEGYQKYFYCPKVSRRERHTGFEDSHPKTQTEMIAELGGYYCDAEGNRLESVSNMCYIPGPGKIYVHGLKHEYQKLLGKSSGGNNHPTVKPVALMRYLIQLVTPPNSTVLDPFTGSGSTGMAATELGHTFIGCELDENYVNIAQTRIAAWNTAHTGNNYNDLFE